jgi:hypothetical protein
MHRPLYPNAKIAANLLRLSALIAVVVYFLYSDRYLFDGIAAALGIVILVGAAWLIGKGYRWVRWVLLVLFLIGLPFDIIAIPAIFKQKIIAGYANLIQNAIQLIVVVLLFIPYKQPDAVLTEDETDTPRDEKIDSSIQLTTAFTYKLSKLNITS